MAGLLQRFYDVGMRIPDGINLDVFEDPVAQEAVVFLLERLERAEALNTELQQCTEELQHRVFTQADALKKREVSPPQQQPKQKKAHAERPARPAGSTYAAPLPYTKMAAEESILSLWKRKWRSQRGRHPSAHEDMYGCPRWPYNGNMAVFTEGVEVSFSQDLPRRAEADVLPVGPMTRYEIPVPLTPTASFETRNNPPVPPRVRRNVYVPPEHREEGAPLFQDVVVEEGDDDDDDDGRSSSEFEGNYDTPDESEDDATKRCRRARGEKEKRRAAARRQEQEGKDKRERRLDAGDTPNGWETIVMDGQYERTLGREFSLIMRPGIECHGDLTHELG
ncbi:hypothetical protein H0H92_012626 [Tricholoma furcatifolium]|nr:hypothetical protein H0H92_012626 [Tricholoma furcatifolium]